VPSRNQKKKAERRLVHEGKCAGKQNSSPAVGGRRRTSNGKGSIATLGTFNHTIVRKKEWFKRNLKWCPKEGEARPGPGLSTKAWEGRGARPLGAREGREQGKGWAPPQKIKGSGPARKKKGERGEARTLVMENGRRRRKTRLRSQAHQPSQSPTR